MAWGANASAANNPADAVEAHPQPLEVAGELLDAVDLAAALDLHRHVAAPAVPAQQVNRADVGAVLALWFMIPPSKCCELG